MDGGRFITFCATMVRADVVQADNGTMKNLMQSKHGTGEAKHERVRSADGDAGGLQDLSVFDKLLLLRRIFRLLCACA